MIYSMSRRATGHRDNCEDAHFTLDFPSMLMFGAFDGCSTGKDTYFASALLARCCKRVFIEHHEMSKGLYNMDSFGGIDGDTINSLLTYALLSFRQTAVLLNLKEEEMLATAVIGIYKKKSRQLLYKFLGDGSIYWIEDEIKLRNKTIHFPKNIPDYPAYHFNDSLMQWITAQPGDTINHVGEFSVCTDGIDSTRFHKQGVFINQERVEIYLLQNQELAASAKMLQRKVNILSQQGVEFDDDLTILRYIP